MDRGIALHTAVRRYIPDRYQEVGAVGSSLPNGGRLPDTNDWSPEARSLIPRYEFLLAVRDEIERLDPDALPTFDDLVEHLIGEGLTIQPTRPLVDAIELASLDDERTRFAEKVRRLALEDLTSVEPLAYRRTLADDEAMGLFDRLSQRWPIKDGDWWGLFGQRAQATTDELIFLREDAFFGELTFWTHEGLEVGAAEPTGPATLALRMALSQLGVERVIALREWGVSREVGAADLEPVYGDGGEGLFFTGAMDWILHATHESVYAVAGAVVAPLERAWPEWQQSEWDGTW